MSNLLAHGFTSAKADDVDTSLIQPSHWGSASTNYTTNPTHVFAGGALGSLLYRDTGSTDGASWLADVAAGAYLRSGGVGVAPGWSTLTLPNAATQGDLLIASSANVIGSLADVAAGSVLVSGGVGAAPAFSATPSLTDLTLTGVLKAANGSNTAPSLTFASDTDTGFFWQSDGVMPFATNGSARFAFNFSQFQARSDGSIGWSSTTSPTGSMDAILVRDAAGTIAQRNSTNAQAFRIYGTFTDASNYERLDIFASGGGVIRTANAGTGSNRSLFLGTGGTNRWQIDTSGNLVAVADNTYDIGASGATRPKNIFVAGAVNAPGGFFAASSITSTSATAGVGYATGAGGTVTQATSKATGVTLSKVTGQITLNAAALAADTTVSFVLTNTAIAAGDVLILNHISAGTPGSYTLNARSAAGSATIDVRNITTGSLSEAIVISFAVLKAVTA